MYEVYNQAIIPVIAKVMEETGEIHMTVEEHTAFLQYHHLLRKLDDMERMELYFHGHIAASYLKRIQAL